VKALARFLLGLYPQAWQERYGEEMAELLSQVPVTLRTLADLVRGALDAYLHPEALPGVASAGQTVWTSGAIIVGATALFGLAWMPLSFLLPAEANLGPLQWCVVLAFLAVSVASVPLLWGSTWTRSTFLVFGMGADAMVLTLLYLVGRRSGPGPDLWLLLGGGFLGSLAGFLIAAQGDETQERLGRLGLVPGALATAAMWAGVAMTLRIAVPAGASWWVLVCGLVMLSAAVGATWALRRGVSAWLRA
jgi:hypothetical protein